MVVKLQGINRTLEESFSDTDYTFNYDDINITTNDSKLIRIGLLTAITKLEYILAFKAVSYDDIKVRNITLDGKTAEYTNLESNPLTVFNREEVGSLKDATQLEKAKSSLLDAISLINSMDINSLEEEDREDFIETQKDATKIQNSILGKSLYIDESSESGLIVKTYYNFKNLFSSSSALTMASTIGHQFKYEADDDYYFNNKNYHSGEYDLTLSQYRNEAVSSYFIADDGSKLDPNSIEDYSGFPEVSLNSKMPTGANSNIPKVVSKIEIIENGAIKYSFTGDDVLRFMFNDLNNNNHDNWREYSNSSDIDITHKIEFDIKISYDTPPKYSIKALNLPSWLHSKKIDEKTISITADSDIYGQDICYDVQYEVNGKREIETRCIYIKENRLPKEKKDY